MMRLAMTVVPPVTALRSPPDSRTTGADSPVTAASFTSAAQLIEKTPAFWEGFVKPKLERDFGGLYRFLNDPYPDGPNPYLERITSNIARLKRQCGMG